MKAFGLVREFRQLLQVILLDYGAGLSKATDLPEGAEQTNPLHEQSI